MTWHVWTDGSCQHGIPNAPKRVGGWGGWCAIVEHGHDGQVLRGRVPDTTNVRMELRAVIEGLRAVTTDPHGGSEPVILHTDCTTILIAEETWKSGRLPSYTGADSRYWRDLAAELTRLDVRIDLLTGKGGHGPIHRRAHSIAGAEARGGLRNLPANAIPLEPDHHRVRKGMRRVAKKQSLAEMMTDQLTSPPARIPRVLQSPRLHPRLLRPVLPGLAPAWPRRVHPALDPALTPERCQVRFYVGCPSGIAQHRCPLIGSFAGMPGTPSRKMSVSGYLPRRKERPDADPDPDEDAAHQDRCGSARPDQCSARAGRRHDRSADRLAERQGDPDDD